MHAYQVVQVLKFNWNSSPTESVHISQHMCWNYQRIESMTSLAAIKTQAQSLTHIAWVTTTLFRFSVLNLKLLINSPCSAGNSDISNELLLQNTHSIRFVFSLFSLRVLQTVLPLPFLTQIENQKQCQMLIEINLHGHLGVWCVNYKLN